MATIAQQRPYGLSIFGSPGPPKRHLPGESGNSGDPGDMVVAASGYAAFGDQNATTTGILGILEVRLSSISADDPVLTTMALPGYYYEFTLDKATSAVADRFANYILKDGDDGIFAVVDPTSGNVVRIVDFVGNVGSFETDRFIGQSDTSETAGASNYPNASKGVVGDTDPRVIVTFDPAALALAA